MQSQPEHWISLTSDALTAQIDPRGAQLSTLRSTRGVDLLWNGDPAFWTGRAPILFPIVGELAGGAYRIGPMTYRLGRHGFARRSLFDVVDSSPSSAALRLSADPSTLAIYPFRFELEVRFSIGSGALTVLTCVRNLGDEPLPASLGYHPGFRWPLPGGAARSAHFIEFSDDEPAPVRRLDSRGLLSPVRHPTPIVGRRLFLADTLFQSDALIFDDLRSRWVTYGADGAPRIRVGLGDAPYLGIWSKPGAGFVCIEPWHGIADPADYTGDFRDKPGVFLIEPGAERSVAMTIGVEET